MKLENITETGAERDKAVANRRYGDACAAAHALEIIGDRWALLVAREMMLGPRRFVGIRRGLPGISANVLTQRLEQLEVMGVVRRENDDGATRYALTEWGMGLEAVTQALGRWGIQSPWHDPSLPFGATSLMLSMRTMIDSEKARALGPLNAAVVCADDRFWLTLSDGELTVRRGDAGMPQFTLSARPGDLLPALYGPMRLAEAEAAELVAVSGDKALAQAFLDLFVLPHTPTRNEIAGNCQVAPHPAAR